MEFNPSKRCLPVGEELKYLTEVSLFFFYYSVLTVILFLLCFLVMSSPSPSSNRRNPTCLLIMKTRFCRSSMFCVQLPLQPLNCMMKHSPTSTKVSLRIPATANLSTLCKLNLKVQSQKPAKANPTALLLGNR